MNIQNIEIVAKIKLYNSPKRPDIKAYVSLVFNGLLVVNGFSIRTSNRVPDGSSMATESYWLARPMSPTKFTYFNTLDEDLWKQLEKGVIEEFIEQQIPVIG